MFRETTITDFQRERVNDDATAEFVMDEETFRAFYERTARGLWVYLARITGDRQQADDLLQETFYRFLRAAARHESEAHRRNSLYRIATNVARDARRRSFTRGPIAANEDIERLASGGGAASAEQASDFARAMAHLKPRERAMLWLAYAEGASYVEIAEVLGLPGEFEDDAISRAAHAGGAAERRTEGRETMKRVDCQFEADALAASLQGRWPERVDAELRVHIDACSICSGVVAIAGAIDSAREEMRTGATIPDAGLVWWRAQLRARREAIEDAARPITAAQIIAFAGAVIVLGACLAALSGWFRATFVDVAGVVTALMVAHGGLILLAAAIVFLVPAAVYFVVLRD